MCFCPATINCWNGANFGLLSIPVHHVCRAFHQEREREKQRREERRLVRAQPSLRNRSQKHVLSDKSNISNPSKNRWHFQNHQQQSSPRIINHHQSSRINQLHHKKQTLYTLAKSGFTVTLVPAGGSYSFKSSPQIPSQHSHGSHRSHRSWALNLHPVCSSSVHNITKRLICSMRMRPKERILCLGALCGPVCTDCTVGLAIQLCSYQRM